MTALADSGILNQEVKNCSPHNVYLVNIFLFFNSQLSRDVQMSQNNIFQVTVYRKNYIYIPRTQYNINNGLDKKRLELYSKCRMPEAHVGSGGGG